MDGKHVIVGTDLPAGYFAGCKGKIAFDSRQEARDQIVRITRRRKARCFDNSAKLNAYHCAFCGKYHIGNSRRPATP